MIFTRPQWRVGWSRARSSSPATRWCWRCTSSASLLGSTSLQSWLMIPGIPLVDDDRGLHRLSFRAGKARDMWQNPLLPPHLLVQALLLGSAILLLLFVLVAKARCNLTSSMRHLIDIVRPEVVSLLWILAITSLIHLLMIWGEVSLTHPTAHARLAVWEMAQGRYASDFWFGIALSALGGLLPLLVLLGYLNPSLGVAGAPLALIGMMLYENAYVQAGQSVPLA